MLHFARGRSPVKMQKALAKGRLPGALPGAESQANMPIANGHARALAPGKVAPGKDPGTTPGKMRQTEHRLFCPKQSFADLFRTQSASCQSFSERCQALCQGLTPGKLCTNFIKKERFYLL
jgi:hypothetical protein